MSYKSLTCGIYSIIHIDSGRTYIGKSSRIQQRWTEHIREYITNSAYSNKLANALRKHGKDAFSWNVVEECPREKLNDREKFWIAKLDTVKNGMNCTIGGDGVMKGFKHSPEERAAKSARQKGKPHSAAHTLKVKMALVGRISPKEEMARLRENAEKMRGIKKILTDEHVANLRAASAKKKGIWKQPPGSHAKQWETRRAKYGKSGLSA